MQAMLLAAGRGERLRPLTDRTPKPLLEVGGKPLIVWHLEKLAAAGFADVVINVAYLGDQIRDYLGDGHRWGIRIRYSVEAEPLETASGIAFALPLLSEPYFAVVSADIFTDYDFARLARQIPSPETLQNTNHTDSIERDFHLVLVPKPDHVRVVQGWSVDCALENGRLRLGGPYTYAGLGVFRRDAFLQVITDAKVPLRDIFTQSVVHFGATGEVLAGYWADVGTMERLAAVDRMIKQSTLGN